MASAVAEVVWLVGLFKEMNLNLELPMALLCNSKAALLIVANPIYHERTKQKKIDFTL